MVRPSSPAKAGTAHVAPRIAAVPSATPRVIFLMVVSSFLAGEGEVDGGDRGQGGQGQGDTGRYGRAAEAGAGHEGQACKPGAEAVLIRGERPFLVARDLPGRVEVRADEYEHGCGSPGSEGGTEQRPVRRTGVRRGHGGTSCGVPPPDPPAASGQPSAARPVGHRSARS